MRLALVGLLPAMLPVLTGCLAFGRAQAGAAMSTSDTPGHTGPVVGVDGVFSLKGLKSFGGKGDFPFGLHNSFETIIAPENKDFAWGTGLALFGAAKPISGHAILGTNLHVGQKDGEFSFGNVSPYAALGVRASLASDPHAVERSAFLSFDLTGQTYIDYLAGDPFSSVFCLKFGVGYGE